MFILVSNIELMAKDVIDAALKSNATDIHILPHKNYYLIQFRITTQLIPHKKLSKKDCLRLISHFKFSAEMDIGEQRRPQTGSFTSFVSGKTYHFRLSTLPSNYDESLVIRILPQFDKIPLNELSLFPKTTKKLLRLLRQAHGLVIFCGPTGSGKTTMIYSLINETIRLTNRNVITLEDPIEKETDQFIQVQVNEKAGVTYTTGLKAILRHDPDIIFVGEIRDSDTAKIAVRAAMTGHLVLSSMHSRDSEGAIHRLLEFGVKQIEIEQSLIAVTSQRLVSLRSNLSNSKKNIDSYNYQHNKRRAAVFEILTGNNLNATFLKLTGKQVDFYYPKLKHEIRKGIALGYIDENEYERWVNDEMGQ